MKDLTTPVRLPTLLALRAGRGSGVDIPNDEEETMMTRLEKAVSLAMVAALVTGLTWWRVVPVRGDDVTPHAKPAPPKPRIAVFRLSGDVTELPPDETFSFGAITGVSLRQLVERIKKAGDDPNVKAVVILHEGGSVGTGQVEELREALAKIRTAGKEVYAHADSLSMR